MNRRPRRLLAAALAALGAWQLVQGGWIHAKALLAQYLLERAWEESLAGGGAVPPWPWADTRPIARMHIEGAPGPLLVLEGDSGRTLAFGPGHTPGSALPGEPGTVLISGHRDTHFRRLEALERGRTIRLETPRGDFAYRVEAMQILDAGRVRIVDGSAERLVLVTCYPFDSPIPGGPGRYVVTAKRVGDSSQGPPSELPDPRGAGQRNG